MRDFPTADRLREQLRQQLGVEVEDRDREWRSSRSSGGFRSVRVSSHDYSRTDDLPGIDVETVNELMLERLRARIAHDYNTADSLRSKLNGMGIEIDDKMRTWTATPRAQRSGYGSSDDERERGRGGGRRDRGGGRRYDDREEGADENSVADDSD